VLTAAGSVPPVGNLSYLKYLDLSNNNLNGVYCLALLSCFQVLDMAGAACHIARISARGFEMRQRGSLTLEPV